MFWRHRHRIVERESKRCGRGLAFSGWQAASSAPAPRGRRRRRRQPVQTPVAASAGASVTESRRRRRPPRRRRQAARAMPPRRAPLAIAGAGDAGPPLRPPSARASAMLASIVDCAISGARGDGSPSSAPVGNRLCIVLALGMPRCRQAPAPSTAWTRGERLRHELQRLAPPASRSARRRARHRR